MHSLETQKCHTSTKCLDGHGVRQQWVQIQSGADLSATIQVFADWLPFGVTTGEGGSGQRGEASKDGVPVSHSWSIPFNLHGWMLIREILFSSKAQLQPCRRIKIICVYSGMYTCVSRHVHACAQARTSGCSGTYNRVLRHIQACKDIFRNNCPSSGWLDKGQDLAENKTCGVTC